MDLKMIKSLQRDFHHTKSRQPAAETLPTPNQPKVEDGTIEEDNEDANHDADGQDEPDDNGEKWEDHEDDCIMDASYCRLRMKILYENGWHTGEIKYCNDHLQIYYVKFRGDYTKWQKFIDTLIPRYTHLKLYQALTILTIYEAMQETL